MSAHSQSALITLEQFVYHNAITNTDSDVRLARRVQRDTVERGRDVQGVLEQVSKPTLSLSIWFRLDLMRLCNNSV